MLQKVLQKLYNRIFVNILHEGSQTKVYIEVCSATSESELLLNAQKIFEGTKVTSEMISFIQDYTKDSPYFYIAFLDNSLEQGVIPTCEKSQLLKYYDITASEYKCLNEQWAYYTSKSDLYALERHYSKVGIDFVFSPFTLLANFFKDKIETEFVVFVLIEHTALALMVYNKGQLLFGEYLDMHYIPEEDALSSVDLNEDLTLVFDDSIDLEGVDVDADELEMIDDFADIADLDSLEEIEEFSEHEDIEEKLLEAAQEQLSFSNVSDKDSFNEDYRRFSLIQASLRSYYDDERYESDFIEKVYIADGVGVSPDFKRYLEEEMFVNVYIRQADVAIEMCELAKMEFRS